MGKNDIKTIAVKFDEQGHCVSVSKVKHVSIEEYELLEREDKKQELNKIQKENDLLLRITKLEEEIAKLNEEIKFLKGEE